MSRATETRIERRIGSGRTESGRIGLRWKVLFLFFLSALLTLVSVLGGIELARFVVSVARESSAGRLLKLLQRRIGVAELAAFTSLLFFSGYVLLLSRRSLAYFRETLARIDGVARGDLETPLPVRSADELGELAQNVNRMVASLKSAREEEGRVEQSKRELLTSVSHDLRTPLTALIGYLALITQGRYRDDEELRRFAEIARRQALKLQELVERLFEFNRLTSGDIVPETEEIDLGELTSQLAEEMHPVFEAAGMCCRHVLPPGRVVVRGDGHLLMRLFENLLQNAARYGRRGGEIEVSVRAEGECAYAAVTNDGEPIPPEDLDRIFERLYRVDGSRSASTGGSGLGLAIAKSIVDLHGGRISASSREGRTRFDVQLPLVRKT